MRHEVVAAAVLMLVVGLPRLTAAEKKSVVAVFAIEAKDVKLKPSVLASLTNYLASKLSESGVYEVVPQNKLKQALTEKKKASYKGCYQQSCQIEIGQELAADKALSTQVMKVGTKCMVTTNLYDLKKTTSGKAATAEGKCTEDGVTASVRQAVEKLTGTSVAPPAPALALAPGTSSTANTNMEDGSVIVQVGDRSYLTNTKDGGVMVLVPAGSFLRGSAKGRGSDDERPQKSIHLDAFYIDKYEVTVAQYRKCVRAGKCRHLKGQKLPDFFERPRRDECNWSQGGRNNHPINCVDWSQAGAYCGWAGKRLPTEAEWEKAARGTDGRKYPWGNEEPSCERAVMNDGGNGCGKDRTWPVGSKPLGTSPYDVQDMAGNVYEWVSDWYGEHYYGNSPPKNPPGPTSGTDRGVRGGFWTNSADDMRTANREKSFPTFRNRSIGFRCARGKTP